MGKKTKGRFDKSGRRKRPSTRIGRMAAPDPGNARVQERRAAFTLFQGGRAGDEVYDGPGQAWAAGLFDGLEADAMMLRDLAREYGDLYWYIYSALLPKSARLERVGKSHASGDPTARDRRFARLDEALGVQASGPARRAVHELCVDHWGSDQVAPWLKRLIESQRVAKGAAPAGPVADAGDWGRWRLALEGLFAMGNGKKEQTRNKLLTPAHFAAK